MLSCDRKVLEDIFDMQPGDVKRLGVALEPPFFCDFVRGNNPPRGGGQLMKRWLRNFYLRCRGSTSSYPVSFALASTVSSSKRDIGTV